LFNRKAVSAFGHLLAIGRGGLPKVFTLGPILPYSIRDQTGRT